MVMPVASTGPSVLVRACQAELGRSQLTDLEIVHCAGRLARSCD